MITVENLEKSYSKNKVLKGVGFTIHEGQTVALMGPNGSGKTTLIKCILGMVRPDKGKLLFRGENISRKWNYRQHIGYMPQAANFPGRMKVRELFSMMKDIRGKSAAADTDNELSETYELQNLFEKRIGTLSGGTKQKVSAALAFLFNPHMLILDEPTTGLDPVASEILKQKIIKERNKGKLIFVSSHIISDVEEVSTHVMYLCEGQLEFVKELQTLKQETGESSLNKAIVNIISSSQQQNKSRNA